MVRMILDVDSAGDDILAILFAARHPEIQLEGVTTVMGASGSIEQATRVALNTLTRAERDDVPVAAGAYRPIVGHSEEDMRAPVHFEKTLHDRFGERLKGFNAPAPEPKRPADSRHAVDFILETVRQNPGEITLVATGPFTNVAMALLQEPDLPKLVPECIVLGGTFHCPGNITPVAEYNIWADPEAAKLVMNSGMKLTIVGLDVCETNDAADAMLTRDDLADLAEHDVPLAGYLVEFLPIYIDIWREFFGLVGFPLDDVIAVALAIDPTLCTTDGPLFVDVELEGRIARGQTVAYRGFQILPADGPRTAHICTTIDGRRFVSLFKNTILGRI